MGAICIYNSAMFTKAILRTPAHTFNQGLTGVNLGAPDLPLALAQHRAYSQALQRCGLELTELPPDPRFPDSTFVEDTAVLTGRCAILTHPGATSRAGEVEAIRPAVDRFYERVFSIATPGTLDGGDICDADGHFFIGISDRTNEEGARQLAAILMSEGYSADMIDIRQTNGILHLKSGISYLGEGNLLLIDALLEHPAFSTYKRVHVPPQEAYAANSLRVNDFVLVPAGFPLVGNLVEKLGYEVIPLEMSEFQKMDGGLSCLSLRF